MTPGTYVYRNSRQHPCFSIVLEDVDRVVELLRVRGIAAQVRSTMGNLAEFEFIDRAPTRVASLLEELRNHAE